MEYQILHSTPKHKMQVLLQTATIAAQEIKTDKSLFDSMCKKGCRNFNNKYCCPPFAPEFQTIGSGFEYGYVLFHNIDLTPFPPMYNTVRMVNSVTKSLQRKLMDALRKELDNAGIKHLSLANGACRLCRSCSAKAKEPCRYPGKMQFSMESTGIDVNSVVEKCFNSSLEWYSKDNFPRRQGVVSMILLNEKNTTILLDDFFDKQIKPAG